MQSYNSYTSYNPIAAVGAAGGDQRLATQKSPSGDPPLYFDDEANAYCADPAAVVSLKRTRAIKSKGGRKAYVGSVGDSGGPQRQEMLQAQGTPSGDPLLYLDDESNTYCAHPAGVVSLKRTGAIKGKSGRKAYPVRTVGDSGGAQHQEMLQAQGTPSGHPLLYLDDESNTYCADPAGVVSLKRTGAIKGKTGRKAYPIGTVGDSGGAQHQEMLQAQGTPSGDPLLYLDDESNMYCADPAGVVSLKRTGAIKGKTGRKSYPIGTVGDSGGAQHQEMLQAQGTPTGDLPLYLDDEANTYSMCGGGATSLRRAGAIKGKVGRKVPISERRKACQVKEAKPLLSTLLSSFPRVSSKTGTPAPALDAAAVMVEELRLFGASLKSNDHERTAQLEFADVSICSIEIVREMWAPSSSSLQNNTPIRELFMAPLKFDHHARTARLGFADISNRSIEIVPEMWTKGC